MRNKKFIVYEDGRLNIVAIRNRDKTVNVFNDRLFVFWKEDVWKENSWIITTEPGLPTLVNPKNIKGGAILVEGQYVDTYSLDIHARNNKNFAHLALCQRLGTVKVYRDNNRNRKLFK